MHIKFAIRNILNNLFINFLIALTLAVSFFLANALMVYNDNSFLELAVIKNISEDRALYYKSFMQEELSEEERYEEAFYLKEIAEVSFTMDFQDVETMNINVQGLSNYLYYEVNLPLMEGSFDNIESGDYLPGIVTSNSDKKIGDIISFTYMGSRYQIKVTGILPENTTYIRMSSAGNYMQIRHMFKTYNTDNTPLVIFPMDSIIEENYEQSRYGLYIKFQAM
jgi:hypothetical protein